MPWELTYEVTHGSLSLSCSNNLLWFPTLASKPKSEFAVRTCVYGIHLPTLRADLWRVGLAAIHSACTAGNWSTALALKPLGGRVGKGQMQRPHRTCSTPPTGWQMPFCRWRNIWLTALTLEDLLSGLRKWGEKAARSKKTCSQVALL